MTPRQRELYRAYCKGMIHGILIGLLGLVALVVAIASAWRHDK
jgi:hypothetical protein